MTQIVPPKWIQEPRDVQAIVGQDVTLPCTVQGFPKPSTVWTRTNGEYMTKQLNYIAFGMYDVHKSYKTRF